MQILNADFGLNRNSSSTFESKAHKNENRREKHTEEINFYLFLKKAASPYR